jgi:hypothetical protein
MQIASPKDLPLFSFFCFFVGGTFAWGCGAGGAGGAGGAESPEVNVVFGVVFEIICLFSFCLPVLCTCLFTLALPFFFGESEGLCFHASTFIFSFRKGLAKLYLLRRLSKL